MKGPDWQRLTHMGIIEDLNVFAQVLAQHLPGGIPVGRDERPHYAYDCAHNDSRLHRHKAFVKGMCAVCSVKAAPL